VAQKLRNTYNVKFVPVKEINERQLKQQIEQMLIDINQLMSTYIQDSELSRFNQWNSVQPFPLSAQTLEVMAEAKRLGAMSDGLLDVTIGPLVNLWGFSPQSCPVKIPTDSLIKIARQQIGLDKLTIGPSGPIKPSPPLMHLSLWVKKKTVLPSILVPNLKSL
jgi:thiamine biosynthesis lipoprotein